ncbi:MAG: hypothetical protein K0R90_1586 [Oscillospiraceae bacterium]|jgi:hypothetical protein|nr:hypothetical protein [Oscillospiraceae bacterium]
MKSIKAIKILVIGVLAVSLLTGLCGCNFNKDKMLDQYNNIITAFGEKALTSDSALNGKRKYGADKYVGTYTADYDNFGKIEYVFGGTSIERDNGYSVKIVCNLKVTDGSAKVFIVSGTDEQKILLDATGEYSETIEISQSSWYIGVEGSGFTGTIDLSVTDAK